MEKCNHLDKDNKSCLKFIQNKFLGVFPKKKKAYCPICKKTIDITDEDNDI